MPTIGCSVTPSVPRMRVEPSAIVPPIAATRDVPSHSTNLPVRHESHSPHGP